MSDTIEVLDGKLVVTADECAKMLGIRPQTLANWRAEGMGPTYSQFGGKGGIIRYKISDIVAFVDANQVVTDSRGRRQGDHLTRHIRDGKAAASEAAGSVKPSGQGAGGDVA